MPRDDFGLTLSKPSTELKSSSAVDLKAEDRGRPSLATSVARAMKVESGRVIPRVVWIRFCTSRTDDNEMATAISVSGGKLLGEDRDSVGTLDGEEIVVSFGGAASLMLLKSR